MKKSASLFLLLSMSIACGLITGVELPPTESLQQCADGIDNEGDGVADCGDADCDTAPNCATLPVANEDQLITDEDTTLNIGTAQLLSNDTEPNGGNLFLDSVQNAINGQVLLNGKTITFTPDPDFFGVASFEYTISNDKSRTDTGLVTITINPIDDPVIAVDDLFNTDEDVVLNLTFAQLTANDIDPDNDTLFVVNASDVINGSVFFNGDGTLDFTPDQDFIGDASFLYTVSDGSNESTALVTIVVGPINDAPIALDVNVITDEDAGVVAIFDGSDAENDPLTFQIASSPVNGFLAQFGGNQVSYVPNSNFNGTDSFTYTVRDSSLTSNVATVTITVNPVNDAPFAADQGNLSTDEDVSLAIVLLGDDIDNDPTSLIFSIQSPPSNGTLSGTIPNIIYTPNLDFNGTDAFTFIANDGTLDSAPGSIAIAVNSINDAPVAVDDSGSTNEDVNLVISDTTLVANDIDVDGDALTVISVQNAVNGAAVLSAGSIAFTPNANFNGTASFEYTVSDSNGGTDVGLVTVTVNAINDAPVAVDDSFVTDEDTALVLLDTELLVNDIDLDGDALTVISVQNAVNGAAVLSAGSITFTPDVDFNGAASFEYTIDDGNGGTTSALVTITINPVNDAPVANNDTFLTDEDVSLVIDAAELLLNDVDVEGDSLLVSGVLNELNGFVFQNGTQVIFTPDPGFNGVASFEYSVDDSNGGSGSALVLVNVGAVNDAPIATDDVFFIDEDTPLLIVEGDLLVNDSDIDGDTLRVVALQNATNGAALQNGVQITFTPNADFNGAASFDYVLSDGFGGLDTATAFITVNPINDVPVAVDDVTSTDEGLALLVDGAVLVANDADIDGDALSVGAVQNPSNGAVSLIGTAITFTPSPGFSGDASFEYIVDDGNGGTDIGQVSVTVNPLLEAIVQISAGGFHNCALFNTGKVRCWGQGNFGQLGYGNTQNIGDNETPASAGDVNVGGNVLQLAAGARHTCALLDTGSVRCWGQGSSGQLGYGNTQNIGDNETPASAGDVNVGAAAVYIAAGVTHSCAVLDTGSVRCWGEANDGRLGYGNLNFIGDDETPASAGDVNVGGVVVQIELGFIHTCALLDTGSVRCWGGASSGQLGYGNTQNIGDNETPASAGDVSVGGVVLQLDAEGAHTCALLDTGSMRCWGIGSGGRVGYGNTQNIGDDELPDSAGDVSIGGAVTQVAAGVLHSCAVLDTGNVRCWGFGNLGQLGYGNTLNIGDNELPDVAGDVDVGGSVLQVVTGDGHSCALLDAGSVRCWGVGSFGRLGYLNANNIGDNETPSSAGDVTIF